MLCFLHFGLFDLLASSWAARGYSVIPIMDAPWKAASLADFWGNRWNRAFSRWARLHVFGPLSRRHGACLGLIGGFLVSGLAHEAVISLPAGSGWGLPTLYFLMQAAGVLGQRSTQCLRGTLPTLMIVLCPAPLLFHPPFLERVFAPMTRLVAFAF
jgi:alginate O-acetyltransferase complex protein AlgI